MQDSFPESGGLCGWFSEESAERWGSLIYSTPNGGAVEVTAVGQCGDRPPPGEFRGPVVMFLRQGREGTSSQQLVLPGQSFSGQRDNYVPQSLVGSAGPPVPSLDLVPGAQGLRVAEAERRLEEVERSLADAQRALQNKIRDAEVKRQLLQHLRDPPPPIGTFQWNDTTPSTGASQWRNRTLSTAPRRGMTPFSLDTALEKAQSEELADAQGKIARAQREIAEGTAQLNAVTQSIEAGRAADLVGDARAAEFADRVLERLRSPSNYRISDGPVGPPLFTTNLNREVYNTAWPSAGTAASDVFDRYNAALNELLAAQDAGQVADPSSPDAQATNYIRWLDNSAGAEDANPFSFMTPSGWASPFSRPAA